MTTRDATRGTQFAELARQVRDAGLMDRRHGYYSVRITATILAYAGIAVSVVLIGPSWWVLVPAALMAVVYTQLAFLGHDAGHKQIFARRRANDLLGVVLGVLL